MTEALKNLWLSKGMKSLFLLLATIFMFGVQNVRAHCPLCVIGAATAAGGAMWLGVDKTVIGLFIGAFSVSVGFWVARLVKKKIIPFQDLAIIILSFVSTVFPILTILSNKIPLYIPLIGQYGSTYILDLYLVGAFSGGMILFITPWISRKISRIRNGRTIPFQGTMLTLIVLLLIGVTIQFLS